MASKRRIRRKACTGKVRHTTIGRAWAHAKAERGRVGQMNAYRCKFCGGFHVGHFG